MSLHFGVPLPINFYFQLKRHRLPSWIKVIIGDSTRVCFLSVCSVKYDCDCLKGPIKESDKAYKESIKIGHVGQEKMMNIIFHFLSKLDVKINDEIWLNQRFKSKGTLKREIIEHFNKTNGINLTNIGTEIDKQKQQDQKPKDLWDEWFEKNNGIKYYEAIGWYAIPRSRL